MSEMFVTIYKTFWSTLMLHSKLFAWKPVVEENDIRSTITENLQTMFHYIMMKNIKKNDGIFFVIQIMYVNDHKDNLRFTEKFNYKLTPTAHTT